MIGVNDQEFKRVVQSHLTKIQVFKYQLDPTDAVFFVLDKAETSSSLVFQVERNECKERDWNKLFNESKFKRLTCEELAKAETKIVKYAERQDFKEDLIMLKEQ